jgi:hypothetical protein
MKVEPAHQVADAANSVESKSREVLSGLREPQPPSILLPLRFYWMIIFYEII